MKVGSGFRNCELTNSLSKNWENKCHKTQDLLRHATPGVRRAHGFSSECGCPCAVAKRQFPTPSISKGRFDVLSSEGQDEDATHVCRAHSSVDHGG